MPIKPSPPPLDPKQIDRKPRLASEWLELSEREFNHRAYALIEKGCR